MTADMGDNLECLLAAIQEMRAKMKARQENKRSGIKSYRPQINAQPREFEACNGHHPIHPGQI